MTPKLQTLAGKLREVTGSVEARAEKLIERLERADQRSSEADLKVHAELDKIDQAVCSVEDLVNQISNGAPPLDDSTSGSKT